MKTLYLLFVILVLPSTYILAQWNFQNSGISTNLYSLYFLDENNGWITGAEGRILKTTNGGQNWVQIPSGTSFSLSFVKFFNENEGIIAGSGGTIKKSTDGGVTWYNVNSGTSLRLQEGSFINSLQGWICGDNGIVLKTTDGGDSWHTETYVTSSNLSYVYLINEDVGFVCSEGNGQIWKTTDGGNTWEFRYQRGHYLWQIHFATQDTGFVVGEFGVVLRSTDGGDSWIQQNTNTGVNLRSVYFHDSQNGWVVGKDEYMLRTTNGGNTWLRERNGPGFELLHVFFLDDSVGWSIGTSGTILFTDNNGGPPVPVELVSFSAEINENDVQLSWITATETNNFGFEVERKNSDEWKQIGFVEGVGTTTEMQYYSFTDNISELKLFDKISYRLKQLDLDGTYEYSKEVEVTIERLTDYFLSQNYPNPFNPSTIINWQLPESKFVTLIIYDVLGNEVVSLINEEKPAGNFEVEFNASALSSGIYYYRIKAGEFTDIKKMILLK